MALLVTNLVNKYGLISGSKSTFPEVFLSAIRILKLPGSLLLPQILMYWVFSDTFLRFLIGPSDISRFLTVVQTLTIH